jgi:hypothetical protein
MFYMSIYDFEYIFTYVEIVHYNPSYVMSYIDTQNDTGAEYGFNLTITTPGHIYVGMEYYSPRMYPNSCHNYTYGVASIFTKDGVLITVNYASDMGLFNYFEFDFLAAGTYYCKVQNYYGPNDVKDFTVRTYSAMPVSLTRLSAANVTTFTNTLMALALTNDGMDTDFMGYIYTPQTLAYWTSGVGFSFFEVVAMETAQNITWTFYTNTTSILSQNATCGAMMTSVKYGNYYQCTCALPAYTYNWMSTSTMQERLSMRASTSDASNTYNPPTCAFAWSGYQVQFGTAFN